MKIKSIVLALILLCVTPLAQDKPARLSTTIPDADFPRVNADGSVEFRVKADDAKEVKLLMELGQSTYEMVKGEDGYWKVTTKPLLPGFHYYTIAVDGFDSNDPYFLLTSVKEAHQKLEEAGIKHVWVESSGAHVWTVWRKYLADFVPRLFQNAETRDYK